MYPFLDGGADKFFSATTRVLDESDPKDRAVISEAHPATPFIANGTEQRLDPQRLSVCIESQDASSKWTYAFDRKSGTLCTASGTAHYEDVFGTPGYDLVVAMKSMTDFNKGEISAECTEVALKLPPNAKVVGISNLRAEILRNTGLPALEAQKVELDKHIQSSKDSESQLLSRIAKFTAEPDKRRDDPEVDQLELIRTRRKESLLIRCRRTKEADRRGETSQAALMFRQKRNAGEIGLDPFAGSNATGKVANSLHRRWIAIEAVEDYIEASKFRFDEID